MAVTPLVCLLFTSLFAQREGAMASEILGQLAQMSAVAIALSYTPLNHGVSDL